MENRCKLMKRSDNQQAWVFILVLSPVSYLIILSSVKWGIWTSWTWRSLTTLIISGFYLWFSFRINFLKRHIDIRGNTVSFLGVELSGSNTSPVFFISRKGYRLRDFMDATGYLSTSCHRCMEIAPLVSKNLLSINFCACAKYEGRNLEDT